MKRLLIISPYFPPSNTPDMQRVRMSLPYFKQYGWEVEVVTVDPLYSDSPKDALLMETVPTGIKIHRIKAFSKTWTSKLGVGNIAFRSWWHYRKKVNELLNRQKFDLIYFSTTQFPICILGVRWKKCFGIPYVIDMQDPWHSEYYKNKPKKQRPPKYWFSYRINKYLESFVMKEVDGLISVSEQYTVDLKNRYPLIKHVPSATITFGSFEPDIEIALKNKTKFSNLLKPGFKNIVYIGRGGMDMHDAIVPVFKAVKKGLTEQPELFNQLKLYFIGTSYAPVSKEIKTIFPLAQQFDIEDSIIEIPERIGYFNTLFTLQQADALFIPGSDDSQYTASKIYPYLLTKKPLLAIFNVNSNAVEILNKCADDAIVLTFGHDSSNLTGTLHKLFADWANGLFKPIRLSKEIEKYSAKNLTKRQTGLFTKAIEHFEAKNTNA